MKPYKLIIIIIMIVGSLVACGEAHDPDHTYGATYKERGDLYHEEDQFDWTTFGIMIAAPRKVTDQYEIGAVNVDLHTYDASLSALLEEKIITHPDIKEAVVLAYEEDILVALDGAAQANPHTIVTQIRQMIILEEAGRKVHITLDPTMLEHLRNHSNGEKIE